MRERFAVELSAVRSKSNEKVALIVIMDGDDQGVDGRKRALDRACADRGVTPPRDGDRVLVCVPTRNIETWLAFLQGETVEETRSYPRLSRPRDCEPHARALAGMCRETTPAAELPPSLQDACAHYRRIFG